MVNFNTIGRHGGSSRPYVCMYLLYVCIANYLQSLWRADGLATSPFFLKENGAGVAAVTVYPKRPGWPAIPAKDHETAASPFCLKAMGTGTYPSYLSEMGMDTPPSSLNG